MKSHSRNPDRNLASAAWQDVLARELQVFAYYHWWLFVKSNPAFASDSNCITVKNAALESSLMSIRDLDDFFTSNLNARPDDLIASDYGFPGGKNFLAAPEREAINKKLTHLTYQAARELHQNPFGRNPRTWNNAQMVNRASGRFLEFLDHLESSFFLGDAAQIGMVRATREMIQITLKNINAISQNELDFPA